MVSNYVIRPSLGSHSVSRMGKAPPGFKKKSLLPTSRVQCGNGTKSLLLQPHNGLETWLLVPGTATCLPGKRLPRVGLL